MLAEEVTGVASRVIIRPQNVEEKVALKKRSNSSIEGKIRPAAELPLILTALIYGRSGTGKTTFSATWPKPLLIVDIREKGTDSVVGEPGIDVISIDTWEELEETYWFLKSGDHKYKTVVLDQVSQMQDLAKRKALKDDGKSEDSVIFSRRIWGNIAGMMTTWLLHYRDLDDVGINVCFIAQDRTTEGEEGEDDQIEPTVGARVMPSVAGFLNASVKVIANTFISEKFVKEGKEKKRIVEYCMRIGPHSTYTTKIRSIKGTEIPSILSDPTFDKVTGIMRAAQKPTNPRRK